MHSSWICKVAGRWAPYQVISRVISAIYNSYGPRSISMKSVNFQWLTWQFHIETWIISCLFTAFTGNVSKLHPIRTKQIPRKWALTSYKWGEITPLIDPIYKAIYRGHLAEILVQNKFLEGRVDACWIGNWLERNLGSRNVAYGLSECGSTIVDSLGRIPYLNENWGCLVSNLWTIG